MPLDNLPDLPTKEAPVEALLAVPAVPELPSERAVGRSLVSRILLILGLLLIATALVIAGFLAFRYLDAQNRYHEINTVSGLQVPLLGDVVSPDLTLEELVFDWAALRATNPDIVAWVIIPGTHVNYPIVQGPNNEYYLHHLFDESSSDIGAVFLDYEGTADFSGRNNITYGHNVFDGSMFTDLVMFKNQDYFNDHRILYLCTPEKNYELTPFATLALYENAPLRQFDFASDDQFRAYLGDMLQHAVTQEGSPSVDTLVKEKVYSFVTCDSRDFSQRVVLACIAKRTAKPLEVKP